MKKLMLFVCALLVALPIIGYSTDKNLLENLMELIAPSHAGTGDLGSSPIGSIIFDSASGAFRGRAADGSWVYLSSTLNDAAWFIDANINDSSLGNISLGTADVSSYTGMSNSTLEMTLNGDSATALIPCSSTNDSTGLTCAAGDESVGVAFEIPFPGTYRACVSFTHNIDTGAGGSAGTVFQIVETPNASQSISATGNTRIDDTYAVANSTHQTPFQVCGAFRFTTTGKKTLRLFYVQDTNGTVTNSSLLTDEGLGNRDIHWEVYKIN
ncbi:MAG: hypothetical protein AB7F59_07410 [Bdellovibrionales bacterium]